jgi:hypothetical protein
MATIEGGVRRRDGLRRLSREGVVSDDEQGLAPSLVGSSFQIGGAIVLAIATASMVAHTPPHATVAQAVHASPLALI